MRERRDGALQQNVEGRRNEAQQRLVDPDREQENADQPHAAEQPPAAE